MPSLFYWHREARNNNAEVDYLVSVSQGIIPVEVKGGTKGSMQSRYLFLDEKNVIGAYEYQMRIFQFMEILMYILYMPLKIFM